MLLYQFHHQFLKPPELPMVMTLVNCCHNITEHTFTVGVLLEIKRYIHVLIIRGSTILLFLKKQQWRIQKVGGAFYKNNVLRARLF